MKWDIAIAPLRRRYQNLSVKMERHMGMEESMWQGRPMGKEVSLCVSRGPGPPLPLNFLHLWIWAGSVSPRMLAEIFAWISSPFYRLLQRLTLFTAKHHGHLLTLTKGGNLILKAGKSGYDQLYFPDEDIETRT